MTCTILKPATSATLASGLTGCVQETETGSTPSFAEQASLRDVMRTTNNPEVVVDVADPL